MPTDSAANHAAALAHLRAADPVLAQVIDTVGPCTLGAKRSDPFHILCTSIIGQQLSAKAADTIQARVHALVGARSRLQPAHLLGATEEALRGCGLSGAKTRYLQGISRAVADGAFSFGAVRKLDDDAALAALTSLHGVGRWTAEMLLIFGYGRPDLFSMGDAGLRRAINRLYGRGRPLSDRRILAITGPWRPWRTVACWYLWRAEDQPRASPTPVPMT